MADTSIIIGSGFFDSINRDRLYSADDMNKPYKDLISEGVYGAIVGSTSTAFAVTPGTGLKVSVAAGHALLGGRWVELDDAEEFDVPSNSSGSSRTDSVILRVDVNNSVRASSLIYRTGTSEAPALVTTSGITEQRIANIIVANGASSISAGNITDERTFASMNVSTTQLAEVLYDIITEHPELITTIADGSITTAKLADGAVTLDKLAAAVIAHFCLTNGYYINLTAGNAEQLISNVYETEQNPYTFRPSGGSLEIGDRETDKLVGMSLPWNQLVRNVDELSVGIYPNGTATKDTANNVITLSSTLDSGQFVYCSVDNLDPTIGHKYLISYDFSTDDELKPASVWAKASNNDETVRATYVGNRRYSFISSALSSGIFLIGATYSSGVGTTVNISFKNVEEIDLTAMFGSTIADYIYSLEQSTAGAGVAWFKRYFPKAYYAYNTAEMLHTKFSAHKMRGFNQFDKSTAVSGAITNGGAIGSHPTMYASDWIRAVPNATYFVKNIVPSTDGFGIAEYDADKAFIKTSRPTGAYTLTEGTFTTQPNTGYLRLTIPNVSTLDSVILNFHYDGEHDGEYEPYEEYNYPLDSDLVLRGIPKIDAEGNLYADGDTYESDGTVTRNYTAITFNGTESWVKQDGGNYYYLDNSNGYNNYYGTGELYGVGEATYLNWDFSATNIANGIRFANSSRTRIYIILPSFASTLDELKTYLANNPLTVVYKSATTTTESADPFTNPQVVDNWGTEEYVVPTQATDVEIPVGHETQYPVNLRSKIEVQPNAPVADGTYVVKCESGTLTYIPLIIPDELPTMPSADGTYTLKVAVASGTPTLSWVVDA